MLYTILYDVLHNICMTLYVPCEGNGKEAQT